MLLARQRQKSSVKNDEKTEKNQHYASENGNEIRPVTAPQQHRDKHCRDGAVQDN
jgi:hypothetical protein